MTRDDDWRKHLESATRNDTEVRGNRGRMSVPGLTILAHPDPDRAGEVAALPALLAPRTQPLSRLEPDFAPPCGGEPRPLADPRLSRRGMFLAPGEDGSVVLDRGATKLDITAEGLPLEGSLELSRDALEGGVVLLLAHRVALLLHQLEPGTRPAQDHGLIGESAAMLAVRREIAQVVDLPFPVLLRGESGTGKELAARAVHDAGPRRGGPFVAVNMGGISPALAASELFGSVKGAFTGADRSRRGHFQRAAGGTLFLDEIGETTLDVQASLLRALETGRVRPVGGDLQEVDVRVISATDADLERAITAGQFRSPLLHRLSSYEITLPPLRRRREDFGRLFHHFLEREMQAAGEAPRLERWRQGGRPWVSAGLIARLAACDWPGNVRELRNVVRQLVVASRGRDEIVVTAKVERLLSDPTPRSQEPAPRPPSAPGYRDPDAVAEEELREALRAERWNVHRAAVRLNVSRPSIYKLMRRWDIPIASQLSRGEIEQARERRGGDLDAMADDLEVGKRGLKLRMKELGLR